jgi:hypothetical protein
VKFPGLRLVARVDRERRDRRGALALHEVRYFAASLDPATVGAWALLGYIRGHWQVENSVHYVKDRWRGEDRHWCRRPGLGQRLAALLNAALNVLRQRGAFEAGLPLRARADLLCSDPARALKLLGVTG